MLSVGIVTETKNEGWAVVLRQNTDITWIAKNGKYLVLSSVMTPSTGFSMAIESSTGWETIFFLCLIFAIIWALHSMVRAIKTKHKNFKAVSIIGVLMIVNIALMFTSIVWFYASFLTLPILIGFMLIEIYDL